MVFFYKMLQINAVHYTIAISFDSPLKNYHIINLKACFPFKSHSS